MFYVGSSLPSHCSHVVDTSGPVQKNINNVQSLIIASPMGIFIWSFNAEISKFS